MYESAIICFTFSALIIDKLLPKRLEHARKLKKDSAKELQQLLDSSPGRFN